jgi:hypothetical protein
MTNGSKNKSIDLLSGTCAKEDFVELCHWDAPRFWMKLQ